jgi:hypothetical protein
MNKLYRKEEEALLNKKKKRDEGKQKNKSEKTRINNRNGFNQYNNYYQSLYIPQMPPMNNQNPAIMNDYQYYYYNTAMQFPPQMYGFPPYFQQYLIEPPKSLKENLDNIYHRGIVNNIIGAFFIKEYQEKMKNSEKRKVPISTVELGDDQGNNQTINNMNENGNIINKDNENINKDEQDQCNNKTLKEENIDEDKNDKNNEMKAKNCKNENNVDGIEGKNKEKEKKENNLKKNIHNGNELKKPDII